jgi:hypothetical protein
MGQPLADCDFNLAALHPAYPIKRRTSAERTQASPVRRHPEESPALDPLENNIDVKRSFRYGLATGPIDPLLPFPTNLVRTENARKECVGATSRMRREQSFGLAPGHWAMVESLAATSMIGDLAVSFQ